MHAFLYIDADMQAGLFCQCLWMDDTITYEKLAIRVLAVGRVGLEALILTLKLCMFKQAYVQLISVQ